MFRYRLSPETFGDTLVHLEIIDFSMSNETTDLQSKSENTTQ
jgi:hypothetical protein